MAEIGRINIPDVGLVGLKNLVALGPEKIRALREIAQDLPLTLNVKGLTSRLASSLEVEKSSVTHFVTGALMPLNHLRVYLKMETPEFMKLLSSTLERNSSEKWKPEDFKNWKAIEAEVEPLFEKDNFFSIVNKCYQLLSNRPHLIQDVKILSELRPVYSEDATTVKAFVLAKTLVVDYAEGETKQTIFFSLDIDDLRDLSSEVDRAKLKGETLFDEVANWGVDLLTYGQDGR
jgi:hypothetical protein